MNKRGRTPYQANRMVLICTVRDIQRKLFDKGHSVSLGKVVSLKPFFITYPTDKEVALCLCKLYLNVRLIMEPLTEYELTVHTSQNVKYSKFLRSIIPEKK